MGPKKIFGKDKAERKLGEVIFGKNDVEKIKSKHYFLLKKLRKGIDFFKK